MEKTVKRTPRKRVTVELLKDEEELPWLMRGAAVRRHLTVRDWIVEALREKLEREAKEG